MAKRRSVAMTKNAHTSKSSPKNALADAHRISQFCEDFDLPYGLIVVGLDNPGLMPVVSNAFIQMARSGINKCGICIPRASQVVSVCTSERQVRHLAALTAANKTSANAAPHEIKDLELGRPIHWTNPEGVLILKPLIPACEGCLMLEQASPSALNTASSIEAQILIRKMAKKARARIMLFSVVPEGSDKHHLDQCCDEYIAINSCEPDFGWDSAFSLDIAGLRDLNSLGIGKAMCNIKIVKGIFRRQLSPYISGQLENRAIWALRAQGRVLDDISKIVKIHKSTVLRRLQSMPPLRRLDGNDELLSQYLDAPSGIRGSSRIAQGDVVTGNEETG